MDEYEHLIAREGKNYSLMHQAIYKVIAEMLRNKPANILEVGSGIGYGIKVLLEANAIKSYEGIEVSDRCCRYINDTISNTDICIYNEDFFDIDLTKLKLYNTGYDFTLCIEVIEHIEKADSVLIMLEELRKLTKNVLFLSTPKAERDKHGKFTGEEMKNMLNEIFVHYVEIEWQLPHTLYICQ